MTFWCGSGSESPDSYLLLMDPDPTPFFSDFIFFSYKLPAGTLFSVLKIKFFAKFVCQNFILQALCQSARHLYEKREDPDQGGPKTCASGSGSGSSTLLETKQSIYFLLSGCDAWVAEDSGAARGNNL